MLTVRKLSPWITAANEKERIKALLTLRSMRYTDVAALTGYSVHTVRMALSSADMPDVLSAIEAAALGETQER